MVEFNFKGFNKFTYDTYDRDLLTENFEAYMAFSRQEDFLLKISVK